MNGKMTQADRNEKDVLQKKYLPMEEWQPVIAQEM